MDMMSVAYQCEQPGIFATGGLAWTIEEIARAIGGDVTENYTLIQELLDKGVARRNNSGAVYCRRMVQDEEAYQKEKSDTRERVRRHRGKSNGDVTPDVTEEKRQCTEDESVCVKEIGFQVISTKELKSLVDNAFVSYCQIFRRNPKQYSLSEKRRKKAELRFLERLAVHEGNVQAVEAEAIQAFKNLAASDFHQSKGFVDWEDQFFRSEEEYEKRINMKPQGVGNANGSNRKTTAGERNNRNLEAIVSVALGDRVRGNNVPDSGAVPHGTERDSGRQDSPVADPEILAREPAKAKSAANAAGSDSVHEIRAKKF